MRWRLRLILFALTTPEVVVERRVKECVSGFHWAVANDWLKELDQLGTWNLVGISLEGDHKANIAAIHNFLIRAPIIIKRLIEVQRKDEDLKWEYHNEGKE